MIILGIDPGYDRCGVAFIEKSASGKEKLLHSTTLTTNPKDPFEQRLSEVVQGVRKLALVYQPTHMALERLYLTKNHKTAMRVAEARGVLLHLAHELGVSVCEYGPGEIKVALTGDGRADKARVAKMVEYLVVLPDARRHDDEYDAIAVALTASAHLR